MGCFLGCFGSSNDKKRKKQRYKAIPRANNNNNNVSVCMHTLFNFILLFLTLLSISKKLYHQFKIFSRILTQINSFYKRTGYSYNQGCKRANPKPGSTRLKLISFYLQRARTQLILNSISTALARLMNSFQVRGGLVNSFRQINYEWFSSSSLFIINYLTYIFIIICI